MRQILYYKMRQKFITKYARFCVTSCDRFISKCKVYYKIRQYKPLHRLLKLYRTNYVKVNAC